MLAPPPAEFSTARRLKPACQPARQPDFTAASGKWVGGAAEGSTTAGLLYATMAFLQENNDIF